MGRLLDLWNAWVSYASGAKILGLAAGVFLYFLFRYLLDRSERRAGDPGRILILYTAVSSLLCICPLTAALLQRYTTAHNSYPWLWSAVPLIPCVAYGFAVLLTREKGSADSKDGSEPSAPESTRGSASALPLGIALSAIILLCGSLGSYARTGAPAITSEYASLTCDALSRFLEETDGLSTDSVVYAPSGITEALRQSGSFRTLYGRDLWEPELSGYLYDVYPESYTELVEWIDFLNDFMYLFDFGGLYYRTDRFGDHAPIDTTGYSLEDYEAMDSDPDVVWNAFLLCGEALDAGADVILIPLREDRPIDRSALDSVAERLGLRIGSILVWRANGGEGFYILYR